MFSSDDDGSNCQRWSESVWQHAERHEVFLEFLRLLQRWCCANCKAPLTELRGAPGMRYCNAACKFPPCIVCFARRPQEKGYQHHEQKGWKCVRCTAQETTHCEFCGKEMPASVRVIGRKAKPYCSDDCRYPPCSGGCGTKRPRRKGNEFHLSASCTCRDCKKK